MLSTFLNRSISSVWSSCYHARFASTEASGRLLSLNELSPVEGSMKKVIISAWKLFSYLLMLIFIFSFFFNRDDDGVVVLGLVVVSCVGMVTKSHALLPLDLKVVKHHFINDCQKSDLKVIRKCSLVNLNVCTLLLCNIL